MQFLIFLIIFVSHDDNGNDHDDASQHRISAAALCIDSENQGWVSAIWIPSISCILCILPSLSTAFFKNNEHKKNQKVEL